MLDYIEIKPKTKALASVIWLHGLGADGHDFVDIVPQLNLPHNLPVRFIFPHAPMRPITINSGYVMRAWYDIKRLDTLREAEDAKGIHDSAKNICALIEHEEQQGIESDKIILAGFSQGGAMALHVGLRYPKKLAGILALSAYLPLADSLPAERADENQNTEIMVIHGTHDPIIPVELAYASKEFLIENGYKIDWRTYSMQHAVCPQEVNDISQKLQSFISCGV